MDFCAALSYFETSTSELGAMAQDENETPDCPATESPRVAYIWSQHLQDVCDDLPSNVGRSGMVHGLIMSFGLLDIDHEGDEGDDRRGGTSDGSLSPRIMETRLSSNGTPVSRARSPADEADPASKDGPSDDQTDSSHSTQQHTRAATAIATTHSNRARTARARVLAPDLSLGTKACLLKYHEAAYVDYLLKDRSRDFDDEGDYVPSSEPEDGQSDDGSNHSFPASSSSSTSSSTSPSENGRPKKRRRQRRHQTPPPSKRSHGLTHDNPPFPSLAPYAQLVAAATSTACRLLARDQVDRVIVWDGGRHHAKRAEASGFCYVADIVLGCMLLSREGRVAVGRRDAVEQRCENGLTDEAEDRIDGNDGSGKAPDDKADLRSTGTGTAAAQSNGHSTDTTRSKSSSTRTRPPRILYLDMDLHHGDGVALAFHSPTHYASPMPKSNSSRAARPPRPPAVLTLSIHHSSPIFFPPPLTSGLSHLPKPTTPHPFTLSIPLSAYPSASTYANVWRGCVEPVVEAWNPDYVVLQSGADGLPGDRVGQWGNWASHGEGSMSWVMQQAVAWRRKLCVLGGGGYQHANTARAWAAATSVLLDRPLDEETPIPHHDNFESYAPSFTLDVPAGHVQDENTPESIDEAVRVYGTIAERIREIVLAHS